MLLFLQLFALQSRAYSQIADGFDPAPNGEVYAIALQSDARILIGGTFGALSNHPHNSIGRVNADSSADSTFTIGIGLQVNSLAVQPDNKILVGANNFIGRLNSNGTLDGSFKYNTDGTVMCMTVQPDGKTLVGGNFSQLGGGTCISMGRLNADGTLDTNFAGRSQTQGRVNSMAVQADGKIVVGGIFNFSGSGQQRQNISRLNADGSSDMAFNPGVGGWVEALVVQPDGKIIVAGCFNTLGGQPRTNIGRLNADGSVDMNFAPGAGHFAPTGPGAGSSFVFSILLQSDGKILVGGTFDTLGGQVCWSLGRLNNDGSLDTNFDAGLSGAFHSLALQEDGKILAGGPVPGPGGKTRNYLGRFSNSGSATQALTLNGSNVVWMRGGTIPEVWYTSFDKSSNGVNWTTLGAGTRMAGGWQLAGVSATSNDIIRARGLVSGGQNNGSSWFVERFLGPPTTNQPAIGITVSAGSPTLGIAGDIGRPYTIEFAPSLDNQWQTLTSFLLTNGGQSFSDQSALGVAQRFYRVRLNQ